MIALLAISLVYADGDLIVQNSEGTTIMQLFNATGNLNITTGKIAQAGVLLEDTYFDALADFTGTLTDSRICTYDDGGTQLVCDTDPDSLGAGNTTEEIQDAAWGESVLGGTQTHITVTYQDGTDDVDFVVSDDWWDALADISLTDGYIIVGNGSNEAVAVAMSGDIAIDNAGATTIQANAVEESMLKAVDSASDEDIMTYESTTGDFEWHTPAELITAGTGISWSGTTLNLDNDFGADISEDELANTDFGDFSCDGTDQGCTLDATYLENVVEDTTPQLGGNLDTQSYNLTGGGSTSIWIDATGNVQIKLG